MFQRAELNASDRSELLNELVVIRKANGMTQEQVADAMQTTQSAVSDIESRANDPRLSTLQRYASAIDCRLQIRLVPDEISTSTPMGATA